VHRKDFWALCHKHHVAQSVGRIGWSQNTAMTESSWATLKREPISRYRLATRGEARRAIIALDQPQQRCASAIHIRQGAAARVGARLRSPSPASCITTCPVEGGEAKSRYKEAF
jgi:hypothetical protein